MVQMVSDGLAERTTWRPRRLVFVAVFAAFLIVATPAPARLRRSHRSRASAAATTLAEGWNGVTWTIEPTLDPGGVLGSTLLGVSCTSRAACTSVGYYYNSVGAGTVMAEVWDGVSWTLQPILAPTGASFSQLSGVSCTSASACTAVGYYTDSAGVPLTLAERWDGITWTVQPTPNPAGAVRSQLLGVSCVSATACTAVGYSVDATGTHAALAEAWDGTSWTIQPTPRPAGARESLLRDVSCTSAAACTADWYYTDSTGTRLPLVERWDGAAWTIQPAPSPAGAQGSLLRGISCTTISSCQAVGYYINGSGLRQALAETWEGTGWRIRSISTPSGASSSELKAVSCASSTTCTSVGDYVSSTGAQLPLTETWYAEYSARHHKSWRLEKAASSGGPLPTLSAVSCPSANDCTAVGSQ